MEHEWHSVYQRNMDQQQHTAQQSTVTHHQSAYAIQTASLKVYMIYVTVDAEKFTFSWSSGLHCTWGSALCSRCSVQITGPKGSTGVCDWAFSFNWYECKRQDCITKSNGSEMYDSLKWEVICNYLAALMGFLHDCHMPLLWERGRENKAEGEVYEPQCNASSSFTDAVILSQILSFSFSCTH